MSQPVKLSDTLVNDARATSALSERSIAGQIEFWAQLGRAIEPLLYGDEVLTLRKRGQTLSLTEVLSSVDASAGKQRLNDHLQQLPYPHYEPTAEADLLIRIEEDGTRTLGRFIDGEFIVEHQAPRSDSQPES